MTEYPGRVALVTGAARGIGAAVSRRLAADGCTVGLLDLTQDALEPVAQSIIDAGGRAVTVSADVRDPAEVESAVARLAAEAGPPTILVNNAGITRDNLLFKMSESDWDDVVAVHLRGAFVVTKAVQHHMVDAGWGRIVSLSSAAALGNRGQLNYSAAKAGLQGFTRTLAIELGRFGITANCIAPGFVDTEMTRATAERIGRPWEEFVDSFAAAIPVGRVGTPDDIASAVSFFVDDSAGFVSGQVLYVSGGPTV